MYPCSVCPVVCIVPCKLFPLQCVYSPLQCWGYPCLAAYMSNVYYKLYSPLQCEKVPCKLQAAMCVVYFLCAGARTLVTRSSARRQNVGGNLSICVHSRRTLHTRTLCVCEPHLSICVDSVAPRAAAPGVVGKAGSRELPAHYQRLTPHLFPSSFQPNVPFRHSISPLKCS